MKIAKVFIVLLGSISLIVADPAASVAECAAHIDPNSIQLVEEPNKVIELQDGDDNIGRLVKPGKSDKWDEQELKHIRDRNPKEFPNLQFEDIVPSHALLENEKTEFSLKITAFLIVDVQRGFLYECAGGTGSDQKDFPVRVANYFFDNINKITKMFEELNGWAHVFPSKDWHPGNKSNIAPSNYDNSKDHISFISRYMPDGKMMEASVGFSKPKRPVAAFNKYRLVLLHPDNTKYKEITVSVFPVHCVQGTDSAEFPAALYQLDKANNWTVVHKGVDRNTEYFTAFVEYPDADEEYMQALPHRVNLRTRLWRLFQVTSKGSSLFARIYHAVIDPIWEFFNFKTDRITLVNISNPNEVIKPKIIITGLAFEVCVKATALSAIMAGFEVYVVVDAVGYISYHGGVNRIKAFEDLEKAGVKFITSDEIILTL